MNAFHIHSCCVSANIPVRVLPFYHSHSLLHFIHSHSLRYIPAFIHRVVAASLHSPLRHSFILLPLFIPLHSVSYTCYTIHCPASAFHSLERCTYTSCFTVTTFRYHLLRYLFHCSVRTLPRHRRYHMATIAYYHSLFAIRLQMFHCALPFYATCYIRSVRYRVFRCYVHSFTFILHSYIHSSTMPIRIHSLLLAHFCDFTLFHCICHSATFPIIPC